MHDISNLERKKYILLETFRKNNQSVKTPVWFVLHNELVYVITREQTGKIKRIKNNQSVRITQCNFFGKPTGKWIQGNARLVSGDELELALKLRKKKYHLLDGIARFVSRKKGNLVAFSISTEK